jgi:hypothetical protein
VPRASGPDSCITRDSKVVVNRVLIGVGWIIEGLRVGVRVEVSVATISPKVPLISNRLQLRWRLARRQTLIAMPLPMACSDSGEWRDYTQLHEILMLLWKALMGPKHHIYQLYSLF